MGFVRGVVCALVAGLLLAAVGLTALRILQPEIGHSVRMVAFTPMALILYAAALALGLVVTDGGVRKALAGLTVAGMALHGWWLAPLWTGDPPAYAEDGEPLTVMTANLLYGDADPYQVVETAAAEDVDVLALVEVTPEHLAEMAEAGLDELFPHYLGVSDGSVSETMLLARTELTEVARLPTVYDSIAADLTVGDATYRVLAVHPRPPIYDAGEWRSDLAVVEEAARSADLVLGDFNSTLDHEPLQRVLDTGLRDAAEAGNAGWQPTWPMDGTLGIPVPLVAIDHVLAGHRLAAVSARTVEISGTDHAAVVGVVRPK